MAHMDKPNGAWYDIHRKYSGGVCAMNSTAKALAGVAAVVLAFFIYLFLGTQLRVRVVSVASQPATERADAFSGIKAALSRGDPGLAVFDENSLGDASEYEFITLTYEFTNIGLLPIEWGTVNLSPESGDVLEVMGNPFDVKALGKKQVDIVLLARKGAPAGQRSAQIAYYAFGRYKSIVSR